VDKLESPEHVAVVGQGDSLLAVAQRFVHHLGDVRSTVEQRVLCVAVEVCECWHGGMAVLLNGLMVDVLAILGRVVNYFPFLV